MAGANKESYMVIEPYGEVPSAKLPIKTLVQVSAWPRMLVKEWESHLE